MTITDSCRDCGGQIERVDTPLPASWAPVPWWFHTSHAEAEWCPGVGPVRPTCRTCGFYHEEDDCPRWPATDDPPEWVPDEETWAEAAWDYAREEARR